MSKNKQSMKLYTEEQVREALKAGFRLAMETDGGFDDYRELFMNALTPIELPSDSLCINCDESKSTHNVCMDCIIKIGKENIQLPSDEEIEEETLKTHTYIFCNGAKWMRDKIQGGEQ